jgi:hypothetical protein
MSKLKLPTPNKVFFKHFVSETGSGKYAVKDYTSNRRTKRFVSQLESGVYHSNPN